MNDEMPPAFDPQIDEFRRRILSILVDERYGNYSVMAFHLALVQAMNVTRVRIKEARRKKELEMGRIVEEGGIEDENN